MSYIILLFHEPLIKLIKEEAVLSIPVVYTMNYYSYYKFVDFRPVWIVLYLAITVLYCVLFPSQPW